QRYCDSNPQNKKQRRNCPSGMLPDNERRSSFPAKSSSYLLNRGKAVLGVGRETFEDNSVPGMLKVWRKLARIYRIHGQPLERLSPGRFILKRPYARDHF